MILLDKLQNWLLGVFKRGTYDLVGDEIVSGSGKSSEDRIRTTDVTAWRIYWVMSFDMIVIELVDGRCVRWFDHHNDLIAILRQVTPNCELPWTSV